MAETKNKSCGCSSSYQDTKYGHGVRVMTVGGTRESPQYTCTVCGQKNKGGLTGKGK